MMTIIIIQVIKIQQDYSEKMLFILEKKIIMIKMNMFLIKKKIYSLL